MSCLLFLENFSQCFGPWLFFMELIFLLFCIHLNATHGIWTRSNITHSIAISASCLERTAYPSLYSHNFLCDFNTSCVFYLPFCNRSDGTCLILGPGCMASHKYFWGIIYQCTNMTNTLTNEYFLSLFKKKLPSALSWPDIVFIFGLKCETGAS